LVVVVKLKKEFNDVKEFSFFSYNLSKLITFQISESLIRSTKLYLII